MPYFKKSEQENVFKFTRGIFSDVFIHCCFSIQGEICQLLMCSASHHVNIDLWRSLHFGIKPYLDSTLLAERPVSSVGRASDF